MNYYVPSPEGCFPSEPLPPIYGYNPDPPSHDHQTGPPQHFPQFDHGFEPFDHMSGPMPQTPFIFHGSSDGNFGGFPQSHHISTPPASAIAHGNSAVQDQPHYPNQPPPNQPGSMNTQPTTYTSPSPVLVKGKRGRKPKANKTNSAVQDTATLKSPNCTPTNSKDNFHRHWARHKNLNGESASDILIQWVLIPGNYNRWREKGSKKNVIGEDISQFLIQNGIFGRDGNSVVQQMHSLEDRYREALERTKQTGGGLIGISGEKSFSDQIEGICPSFYELDQIMGDRPSAMPFDEIDLVDDVNENDIRDAFQLRTANQDVLDVEQNINNPDFSDLFDPSDTNDDSFNLPAPLQRDNLMAAIQNADQPKVTQSPKHRRESTNSIKEDSFDSHSDVIVKKRRPSGSFLKSIGFRAQSPSKSVLKINTSEAREKADENYEQRERAIQAHSKTAIGTLKIGQEMSSSMKTISSAITNLANPKPPPRDKIAKKREKMQLRREKWELQLLIHKQKSENDYRDLELTTKTIRELMETGMSSTESTNLAERLIENQKQKSRPDLDALMDYDSNDSDSD
ncbi:uncharacterized protein MELLADRAFT_90835 [Melampsora larici-populina 98AG31]|uniref:Uncharacterized protein n=1 Tax=Melampsora larici-populina (strain 98AG31 / pathotype 3-4-7) TaxID=747676 RepID=F4R7P1_MELLP|nr:uncharacterized protein MELLADRAFT_90835 [Melampsora larici-populina 98AG31]EGG11752.1 hypothetical protein MELLADRAFT_90835 [Melampsora larici-populina 98AG31]